MRILASASQDKTLRLWDAKTGKAFSAPLRHEGWLLQVVARPNGLAFTTAGNDYFARIWEIPANQRTPADMQTVAVRLRGSVR